MAGWMISRDQVGCIVVDETLVKITAPTTTTLATLTATTKNILSSFPVSLVRSERVQTFLVKFSIRRTAFDIQGFFWFAPPTPPPPSPPVNEYIIAQQRRQQQQMFFSSLVRRRRYSQTNGGWRLVASHVFQIQMFSYIIQNSNNNSSKNDDYVSSPTNKYMRISSTYVRTYVCTYIRIN